MRYTCANKHVGAHSYPEYPMCAAINTVIRVRYGEESPRKYTHPPYYTHSLLAFFHAHALSTNVQICVNVHVSLISGLATINYVIILVSYSYEYTHTCFCIHP